MIIHHFLLKCIFEAYLIQFSIHFFSQNHQPLQEEPATELLHVRINRELDAARDDLIRDWKRLPDIISQSHIGILQVSYVYINLSLQRFFF